jgi:ABC-2 type transport system ATP-binding protein
VELHIRDVSKTYSNGVQALKDVTLTIPAGMYGLLGPNGAGKSTLMRILATLQEPDEGSIRLGDTDVLNQKDEVRKTLGYLPQEFGVYPKVSAENLLDLYTLLQILSVHLFEKAPLAQVLAGPDYTLDDTHVRNQLRLFDF